MDGESTEMERTVAVESLRTQVAAIHAALEGLTDQLNRLAEGISGVPAGTGPKGALDAMVGLEGVPAGTGPKGALRARADLDGPPAPTGPRFGFRAIDGVPAPTGPHSPHGSVGGSHVLTHGDTAVELSNGARWVRVHGVLVVF